MEYIVRQSLKRIDEIRFAIININYQYLLKKTAMTSSDEDVIAVFEIAFDDYMFQRVKIQDQYGSGKDIAEDKRVH